MSVFEELKARGIIAQTTGDAAVKELIDNGKAVFYIGFDPTADSLTVGHTIPLILMRHLQRAGNKPIALLGGGTTMVGDPTDKTEMRSLMTKEKIARNAECFRGQIGRFIDFDDGGAVMVNNADWLLELNYIDFLREVGVHYSVNRMLTAECYKSRLERGLSFLEFNYMLMQGYDYYHLHKTYGCNLQCGGDDQWANMLGGTELIRRKTGADAHVLTATLLLTSEGVKMGKTAKGALWLDSAKTSVYELYQYFRNTADADVINYLKRLTFLPLEEINALAGLRGEELNAAKELLALEVTALAHGRPQAEAARSTARSLFAGTRDSADTPATIVTRASGLTVTDLLVLCGLAPSKSEARRVIEQGGLEIDGEKVTDIHAPPPAGESCLLRKGKKAYHRVNFTRPVLP